MQQIARILSAVADALRPPSWCDCPPGEVLDYRECIRLLAPDASDEVQVCGQCGRPWQIQIIAADGAGLVRVSNPLEG